MGRSYKPKYRVEVDGGGYVGGGMSWDCKQYGRPTDKALAAWVLGHFRSLEAGGVNGHIGRRGRFFAARVVQQGTARRPDVLAAVWPNTAPRRAVYGVGSVCTVCGKPSCDCGTAKAVFAQVDAETASRTAHGLGLCPGCGPCIVEPTDKAQTVTGFACTHCGTPAAGPIGGHGPAGYNAADIFRRALAEAFKPCTDLTCPARTDCDTVNPECGRAGGGPAAETATAGGNGPGFAQNHGGPGGFRPAAL
jgi:hypothetical protein